jgi:predicted  nucleic acid-binding Zn-ribbon protein
VEVPSSCRISKLYVFSFSVQFTRARDDVLRLRNELEEKDNRITKYESELCSEREQAKRDRQTMDEIINALEEELEVQREKVRNAPMIKVCSAYSQ